MAASGLALATLAIASPAQAAPVFTDAGTLLNPFGFTFSSGANCTSVPVNDSGLDVPVLENGPTATATASSSATYGNTATPSDTGTWSSQATATGKVTSVGGNPGTLDFSTASTYALTNALGTSPACTRGGYAGIDLDFAFTVTQAGFMHLTFKNTGPQSYGEVYIESPNVPGISDNPYFDHYGYGRTFNTTSTIYLPAGTYSGYFEGESYVRQVYSASGSSSTSVHAQFTVAGSQTAAATGKGKKYVTLPTARSCATHSINASVTGKKKRADQVKQVNIFVNDAKVKKIKTPDKGDAITIAVADDTAADVRAEVKLFPRKKGHPGKVVEVSASYEACS